MTTTAYKIRLARFAHKLSSRRVYSPAPLVWASLTAVHYSSFCPDRKTHQQVCSMKRKANGVNYYYLQILSAATGRLSHSIRGFAHRRRRRLSANGGQPTPCRARRQQNNADDWTPGYPEVQIGTAWVLLPERKLLAVFISAVFCCFLCF